MNYTEAILSVNAASIAILVLLALLLLMATRFKGMSGYAALIIILPTVPVYLYNMSRMLEWHGFSEIMLPFAFSVNTMLMPLLWIFTKANFTPDFKFSWKQALHFLPGLCFLTAGVLMSSAERMELILHEMSGDDTLVGDVNTMFISLQLVIYFPAIFLYIRKRRKSIEDSDSDAEWMQKLWIPRFMALFAALFVVVMVSYALWPRTDAWLIQIANVVAMSYLVYHFLAHPSLPMAPVAKVEESRKPETSVMTEEEMKEVCESAIGYLKESKAYLRPDISLAIFAKEADIPQRVLSRSINGYLKINFFDFINRQRVEEAKRKLLTLEISGYSIDSIYLECGFRSRSSFFMVFKKIEGVTPASWLEAERGRQ